MSASRAEPVLRLTPAGASTGERRLPVEAPIAVEYNGIGYAVMMATPADLEDFALGFSLSERIVESPAEIEEVEATETEKGWLLRIQLARPRMEPLVERVRTRVSESSCGLCGLENLDMVARPLPPVRASLAVEPAALFAAFAGLRDHQPLNALTGATHAAALCAPDGGIRLAREDVGRHCALDKLIGAAARAGLATAEHFILLSSRCSYELVEKTVIAGAPLLVTISSATTLAADRARAAGLALVALARSDAMLVLNDPGRMLSPA